MEDLDVRDGCVLGVAARRGAAVGAVRGGVVPEAERGLADDLCGEHRAARDEHGGVLQVLAWYAAVPLCPLHCPHSCFSFTCPLLIFCLSFAFFFVSSLFPFIFFFPFIIYFFI